LAEDLSQQHFEESRQLGDAAERDELSWRVVLAAQPG
jgi:hypothetical protein